jgi:hypothetical protein
MFENEFYPTPNHVIERMLRPLVKEYRDTSFYVRGIRKSSILEPSAGKGNILDYLRDAFECRDSELFAIEIDPELRATLNGKGYTVIDTDFLEYDGARRFDLIVMNPPFSNGVDHILKAWDILYEGDIICLLNAETVRNPYSQKRQMLQNLITKHGCVEELGSAFAGAEVPTNVEVVIVRLKKEAPKASFSFDGKYDQEERFDEEEFAAAPLAHANIIESLVAQYNAAKEIMVQQSDLQRRYLFYVQGIQRYSYPSDEEKKVDKTLNERLDELKKEFWRYIFEKTRLGQVTTSDFQKRFDQFTTEQSRMAFSVRNIMEVLEMFFLNRGTIMEECLMHVFDEATKFHADNRVHWEGWKTNKSWRVARKIIVPYGVQYDQKYGSWNTWSSYRRDFFNDIDKVMCFLSGRELETISTVHGTIDEHLKHCGSIGRRASRRYDEYIYSTFFKIRIFKKGTVHLYFERADLWEQFNLAAAKGKNWVGDGS